MKLGLMQPYFFPYLGYFALIAAVDQWVVFDITQYTKESWMNRNRILHPAGSWQYATVPVKKSPTHTKIFEKQLVDLRHSERRVLAKIAHYKRKAPYYEEVCRIVKDTFAQPDDGSLVSLTVASLRNTCEYLGIPFNFRVCSELPIDYPDNPLPGQWAPWIAGRLSAETYINPAGGRELFNQDDFERENVRLQFLDFETFVYSTPGYEFEPSLSVVDVMMWNSPAEIIEAIKKNSFLISADGTEYSRVSGEATISNKGGRTRKTTVNR